MKESDLIRKQADMMDMVEGSTLKWYQCVKQNGRIKNKYDSFGFKDDDIFDFALAIVEGRPVFTGDTLYWIAGFEITVESVNDGDVFDPHGNSARLSSLSWNKPKPKTVTIELPLDDADALADYLRTCLGRDGVFIGRLSSAFCAVIQGVSVAKK